MTVKNKKLTSRRFFAALWAMAVVTFIVVTDRSDYIGLATILVGIVGVWIGSESYTKKAYIDRSGEHREEQQ